MDVRFQEVVDNIFLDKLAALKSNVPVPLFFVLFYSDGYCVFEPDRYGLDKEPALHVVHDMVLKTKPESYCVISDTYVRNIKRELIGEQLLAILINKDGESKHQSRPYVREAGRIRFVDSEWQDGGITMAGRMSSFFQRADQPLFQEDGALEMVHQLFVSSSKTPYDAPSTPTVFN